LRSDSGLLVSYTKASEYQLSEEHRASILRVKIHMVRKMTACIRTAGTEPRGTRQMADQFHRGNTEDGALSGPMEAEKRKALVWTITCKCHN